jgi:hypothetical protein
MGLALTVWVLTIPDGFADEFVYTTSLIAETKSSMGIFIPDGLNNFNFPAAASPTSLLDVVRIVDSNVKRIKEIPEYTWHLKVSGSTGSFVIEIVSTIFGEVQVTV